MIQSNLWPKYGKNEVKSAIKEAETAFDGIAQIPVTAVNRDGYELRWVGAKAQVQDMVTSLAVWRCGLE